MVAPSSPAMLCCIVILSPQVRTSGEFKAFDYGSKNQAIYNQVGVVVLVSRTSESCSQAHTKACPGRCGAR